jgi:hypothetical protein
MMYRYLWPWHDVPTSLALTRWADILTLFPQFYMCRCLMTEQIFAWCTGVFDSLSTFWYGVPVSLTHFPHCDIVYRCLWRIFHTVTLCTGVFDSFYTLWHCVPVSLTHFPHCDMVYQCFWLIFHVLTLWLIFHTLTLWPVRIRVRIDSPHPFVCCKRRLNGAVLWMRPEKPRPHVTAGVAR